MAKKSVEFAHYSKGLVDVLWAASRAALPTVPVVIVSRQLLQRHLQKTERVRLGQEEVNAL